MDIPKDGRFDMADRTAKIVRSYVSHTSLSSAELPALIGMVHASLRLLSVSKSNEPAPEQLPAVPIRKSVTPDFLICLEDGKKFKTLRRHLTKLSLTPETYRDKWGLPCDYPMVAPNYAVVRSRVAKQLGLGIRSGRSKTAPPKRSASSQRRARPA